MAKADEPEPEPEEVKFEQVSHESPLSTLDVLRRMGATLDVEEKELAPAAKQPLPKPSAPRPDLSIHHPNSPHKLRY